MEGIKDTSTPTLRKILGNGLTYVVPKFQRDYSWESEHWDDLWQDLESLYEDREDAHYMGYLVLQTPDQKEHKVIDGQQRITTLSLLIISVLKRLKELEEGGTEPDKNKIRREQLQNSYIGYLDPVTLVPKNKLKMNRNNDDFYRAYIVPLRRIPQRNTNASEKLMRACCEWYYKKVTGRFKTGEELVGFIDKIVDKLFFTVLTVGDELNAYKVFETLNARGVQLSSSDLLKNYLFSTVDADPSGAHNEEFNQLEIYWGQLIDKLGSEKLPEFLRHYWNSFNKTVRKNELFKTIKKSIRSKQQVFNLLRDVVDKADSYKALLNPNDELWIGKNDVAKHLGELRIFGAKQPISLLMSAHSNLGDADFLNVLRICSIVYMRYNVIGGLNPNEQESTFNKIARYIAENKKVKKADFEVIYPSDEAFEVNFASREFTNTARNRKVIKYILTRMENAEAGVDYDFTSDKNTIEHILPEHPNDDWDVTDEVVNRCRYKLGNMTLLEKGKNNALQNAVYSVKKNAFKKSAFVTTKKIVDDYINWGEDEIIRRQKWMAKQAKSIWKLQLS